MKTDPRPLTPDPVFRSGFVALAGRPNVGKSTLVNRLVGQKVAITASVPQTTRTRLQGIVTQANAQIILIDTPGIHPPRHRLGHRMVDAAREAFHDADVILFIVDAGAGITDEDRAVAALLKGIRAPVVVALNKTDRAAPGVVAGVEAEIRTLGNFAQVVPISAAQGINLDRLVDALVALLPAGPQYFPPEMVTDQPEQFLAREFIREQAIRLTREELPHSIAVEMEEFTRRGPRQDSPRLRSEQTGRVGRDIVYIRAVLHVERDSHKKMLIGKDGRLLKEIGRRARQEIERLLGRRVYLDLWVKVSPKWRERDEFIKTLYHE